MVEDIPADAELILREIKKSGVEFETKWGKGLGIESINDSVVKLAESEDI